MFSEHDEKNTSDTQKSLLNVIIDLVHRYLHTRVPSDRFFCTVSLMRLILDSFSTGLTIPVGGFTT